MRVLRSWGGTPGPPDFVGVGTLGPGPSRWHDLLLAHPDVRRPRGRLKKLHFFDAFCAREMTEADVDRYHQSFPRRAGQITGEWTPRYVYDAWTPPLLRRAAPDAKLLMMVSDPIEHYRSLLAARETARGDEPLLMADVVGRSRYATQLRRLLEFHPQERVLVLQYEKCMADPFAEYARTLRFLGLRDDHVPRSIGPRAYMRLLHRLGLKPGARRRLIERVTGRGAPQPLTLWPDIEASLHDELDPEVTRLSEMVPELDLGLWPNFGRR